MIEIRDLGQMDLLALGRRASELCAGRFEQIRRASYSSDVPLQELLRKMAFDAAAQASYVEQVEHEHPEDGRLATFPEEALRLIRNSMPSLSKRFGEGPLDRDIVLFLAESVQEEASRFYRVLAGHSRESRVIGLFYDMAEHQRANLHQLRDVVLG